MTLFDYQQYFPFQDIRTEQHDAIQFALNAFMNEGKKFVILEIGTGGGKSAIAITLARYLAAHGGKTYTDDASVETSGAYVLTTQKILQAQYMADFGQSSGRDLTRSIKSASDYECRFYSDMTCSDSKRLLKQVGKKLDGTEFQKCCRQSCPYTLDKEEFINFPISVTNFSYFFAETMYAKQLLPRGLLVIDEAHNIESQLGKIIEVTFSEKFARNLRCKIPKLDTQDAVFSWIKGPYKNAVSKEMNEYKKKMSAHFNENNDADSHELSDVSKRYEMLDKHICKINRFIEVYSPDNWIMNLVKSSSSDKRGDRKFEFKPIDVSSYGNKFLYKFGSRVVMMSATIVDKVTFCKSTGIAEEQVAFLRIASPFPVANRPVHFLNVGSMSRSNIENTLPAMAKIIKDLLSLHKKEKGIIHTVNYRVAKYIVDTVKSPRLLLHDSSNREEMIEFHMKSPDATVLISPSMAEGIDLADDASRFQILCKVPFPYLGDQVVQLRKQKIDGWYACQTARSVIQAFGRSIRNDKDRATSYILDSDWERFYRNNRNMFPSEFSSALT